MRLAEFIVADKERVLEEWEAFARTLPSARRMDARELRDHASQLLDEIVADMRAQQPVDARKRKSRGDFDQHAEGDDSAAQTHGSARFIDGFDITELAAEYRALRASVIRLWPRDTLDADDAISDLIRFGEALDKSLAESVQRFDERLRRARELFLGTLAHDVRTPLQAVLLSAETLKRAPEPARVAQVAERVLASGRRMQRIVEDLFDALTARLHGGLRLSLADADLVELCQAVLDEMRTLYPERRFDCACPDALQGRWDVGRVGQALSNLVANAVRHGSGTGPITLGVDRDGDTVRVRVHNEGEPISADQMQRLFKPLARGEATEGDPRRAGLGLGLYITASIARSHGGSVDVESSAGAGTTFTLCLPLRARVPDPPVGPER